MEKIPKVERIAVRMKTLAVDASRFGKLKAALCALILEESVDLVTLLANLSLLPCECIVTRYSLL